MNTHDYPLYLSFATSIVLVFALSFRQSKRRAKTAIYAVLGIAVTILVCGGLALVFPHQALLEIDYIVMLSCLVGAITAASHAIRSSKRQAG